MGLQLNLSLLNSFLMKVVLIWEVPPRKQPFSLHYPTLQLIYPRLSYFLLKAFLFSKKRNKYVHTKSTNYPHIKAN